MSRRAGTFYVAMAYFIWGILPLYWKQLHHVPAAVVLVHRVCWTLGFLLAWLACRGGLAASVRQMRQAKVFRRVVLCALLIAGNWLVYVWAMGHGRIVESGLGYFMSPMVTFALGWGFLGERISPRNFLAMSLVLLGVSVKVWNFGSLPWVAVWLALTFPPYVLLRKISAAEPVSSMFQEMLVVAPLVCLVQGVSGQLSSLFNYDSTTLLLLAASGPLTAIPMLLMVRGLREIPVSTVAVLQYITPSLLVLTGVIAGESLLTYDWIALALIWTGCAVSALGGFEVRIWARRLYQSSASSLSMRA